MNKYGVNLERRQERLALLRILIEMDAATLTSFFLKSHKDLSFAMHGFMSFEGILVHYSENAYKT